MPDYRRLVSYIYNYEDGNKRNNIGYARVEARNGQCKCTIHVTVPSLNEKELKAYMFKREGNSLKGILLGSVPIRNGVGEYRITTDPMRLMNTSYAITDISGLVLLYTDRKFLATMWDEVPITMEMVRSLENPKVNVVRAEEPLVEAAAIKEGSEEVKEKELEEIREENSDKIEAEEIKKELNADKLNADGTNKEELNKEKTLDGISIEKEGILENQRVESKETGNEKVKSEEIESQKIEEAEDKAESLSLNEKISAEETQNSFDEKNNSHKEAKKWIYDQGVHIGEEYIDKKINLEPKEMESKEIEISSENIKASACPASPPMDDNYEEHPLAKRLAEEFTRMHPFEDNEILWCVRLEPKDLSLLPVDYWPLSNNSFLLHGFYGHKHLIFAKVNNKNANSYILGVPGIYHNRERFMARMFGFENFKCAKRRERRIGEFGYWFIPIQLQ